MSSRRIVRKQPLLSKIKSFPLDFLLYLNEIRMSIEWDDYTGSLAFPLGVGLSITSLIIKSILSYYESIDSKSRNILFDSDHLEYQRIKSSFLSKRIEQAAKYEEVPLTTSILWLLNIAGSLIQVIMLMNTYSIITKKKNYGLLYCQTKPKSASVIKSSIESISYVTQALKYILRYVFNKDEAADITVEVDEDQKQDNEIWQLNVWDPSKFSLYFFIGLNPINSLIIHHFDPAKSSLLYTILLSLSVSLTIHFFIDNFYDLLNDKQILYQEMFNEYNNKFVKPKTSILKKDVLIDATLGPFDSSILTDIRPYAFNKSKLWVTHDLKGNQVVDYGDSYDEYGENPAPFVDFNLVNDSNQLLNRLKVDYDELRVKNQELCRQLARLTKNDLYYQEFDTKDNFKLDEEEEEDDDDSNDNTWYTSSTPYKAKAHRDSREHGTFNESTGGRHDTPKSFRGQYIDGRSSVPSRSPSPSKLMRGSPALSHTSYSKERSPTHQGVYRERSNSHTSINGYSRLSNSHASIGGRSPSHNSMSGRSPSPIRVIHSPSVSRSRVEPFISSSSNGLGIQTNLFNGIPTNVLRSPSPSKYPSHSQSPFKSPSPVKHHPPSPKRTWR